MGKRIVLAYNPTAGRFSSRALARLRQALERAGHTVSCENSREFRFDAAGDPADIVCAYGGDGTARTVIGGNRERAGEARYCVFPSGTVNLIAREAHYPSAPPRFARMVGERDAATPCHYGLIGEEAFLCCASIGPDAEVVARVSPWLKRRFGRLAYAVSAVSLLRAWPRRRLAISVDGVTFSGEALFVCKGRYYAGPWVIDEDARLANDHFRILILPRARRRDFLRLALSAVIHPMLSDRGWHRLSGRSITVDAALHDLNLDLGPASIQADGDVVEQTPATISIAPAPLHFL